MAALIVIWLLCALGGAIIAEKRGRSPLGWAVVCLFTGLIGLLIVAVIPRGDTTNPAAGRVPCPACREAILPEARICPHCKTSLSPMQIADGSQ
jgi:hypothetical protein